MQSSAVKNGEYTTAREYFERRNADRFDDRFAVHTTFFESDRRLVGSAWDSHSNELVSFQTAIGLNPGTIVSLQHELSVIQGHACDSLFQPVDAFFDQDAVFVIDRFVEGQSLNELAIQKPFNVLAFLEQAISLFHALIQQLSTIVSSQ